MRRLYILRGSFTTALYNKKRLDNFDTIADPSSRMSRIDDPHFYNGLIPYLQNLEFPVQHFTRCWIYWAYFLAERGRGFTPQYPGLETPTVIACLRRLASESEWRSEIIIYRFIWRWWTIGMTFTSGAHLRDYDAQANLEPWTRS